MTPKPQLVMDMVGFHNRDPKASQARLIKGNSWKHQRIVVILPAGAMIPTKAMLAMWNLAFPPNNGVLKVIGQGMEVGDSYSQALEFVLGHPDLSKWEYVLTIEHDNVPPSDGVLQLLERMEAHPEFACIGGLYFTKFEGGVAQIWGDINDPVQNYRPQPPRVGELVECWGTGMGFNLWRMSMFRDPRLPRPLFRTKADKTGVGTQDLVFWGEARKLGYRCAIDCRCLVGHLDPDTDMVW